MGNTMSIRKINFEDICYATNHNNDYIIINTLDINNQDCLIKNTISPLEEIDLLNKYLAQNKEINIIIYGLNSCDETIYKKYEQLNKLGFYNIFVYSGGLFEWLLLQEVYGSEEFPTTKKELDILKFKGSKIFDIKMIGN
jgi:hypothetical protein